MNLILDIDLIKKGWITNPDNLEEVTAKLWRIQNLKYEEPRTRESKKAKKSAKISTVKK